MLLLGNKFQVIRVSISTSINPTIEGPIAKVAIELKPKIKIVKDLKPTPRG